jgi:hypothetical protein
MDSVMHEQMSRSRRQNLGNGGEVWARLLLPPRCRELLRVHASHGTHADQSDRGLLFGRQGRRHVRPHLVIELLFQVAGKWGDLETVEWLDKLYIAIEPKLLRVSLTLGTVVSS